MTPEDASRLLAYARALDHMARIIRQGRAGERYDLAADAYEEASHGVRQLAAGVQPELIAIPPEQTP